ncbi:MAG: hypothetical protein ABS92_08805 [Thiobacillus sp. SCN 63-374]|nr:MAG: hypothetical protein ABS92_08805 [Thiobacillus sp. SCN 63-374]
MMRQCASFVDGMKCWRQAVNYVFRFRISIASWRYMSIIGNIFKRQEIHLGLVCSMAGRVILTTFIRPVSIFVGCGICSMKLDIRKLPSIPTSHILFRV